MNILLIEDDKNKSNQIVERLEESFFDLTFHVERSYQKGVKTLRREKFDLLLLDMTLPTFDINENNSGGKIKNFAGMEILEEMFYRNITTSTIVVTQYENFGEEAISIFQLENILKEKYSNFIEIIYYSSSSLTWFEKLRKAIEENR